MDALRKSPIEIQEIVLQSLSFEQKSPELSVSTLPEDALNIAVTIRKLDELKTESISELRINTEKENPDFVAIMTYRVVAAIKDASLADQLEKFSKFGAPFNILVHAREMLIGLSARAFGEISLIPLLDIQGLTKFITFTVPTEPSLVSKPPTETSPQQNE